MTENNGRFGKWFRALGQSINMIKWVMGDVWSAFGAPESAFCTPGGPGSDTWAQSEAQTWHTAGCWASCTGLYWSPAAQAAVCPLWMDSRAHGPGAIFKDAHRVVWPVLH